MINPVQEIYEMEFRQADLAKEMEHNRLVKTALGSSARGIGRFLAKVGHILLHQLGRLRSSREVSVDLTQTYPEGSVRKA